LNTAVKKLHLIETQMVHSMFVTRGVSRAAEPPSPLIFSKKFQPPPQMGENFGRCIQPPPLKTEKFPAAAAVTVKNYAKFQSLLPRYNYKYSIFEYLQHLGSVFRAPLI
jgi:hypothetical protein